MKRITGRCYAYVSDAAQRLIDNYHEANRPRLVAVEQQCDSLIVSQVNPNARPTA